MTDTLITRSGGCHCGAVRFEVDAPGPLHVLDCNCSMCSITGFLHLIVPRERFRLLRGADSIGEYRFNTGTARHLFCRHCGVKSFYVPRSHPHGYSVNARCLDGVPIGALQIVPFDDRDRDAAMASLAAAGL
ncbi:MAG TPA: GFA family protein [Lysobacter sp.]|nr:GFA family protein [Lysobacter sp.]